MKEDCSGKCRPFSAAEIGALAHLYRGEMYRSKIWRTRLDATTNWAVVTVGIALSVSFASETASALPIVLVGGLLVVFLMFEARRYRFFDTWRTRVRVMETSFYGPILRGENVDRTSGWADILADDLTGVYYHISYSEAIGRRLRRNFGAIFALQMLSYVGKLAIHPTPLSSTDQLFTRAAIGPLSGQIVLIIFVSFYSGLLILAVLTLRHQQAAGRAHNYLGQRDRMREITRTEIS